MKCSNNTRMFSPQSEKITDRVIILLIISALFVGHVAHELDMNIESYYLYEQLSLIVPAVGRQPYRTIYFHEAQVVWLYLSLVSPIVLFYLFYKVRDLTNEKATWWIILVLLVLFMTAVYGCIIGYPYEGPPFQPSGRFERLFYQTLYGMIFASAGLWALMLFCFFVLINWFINFIKGKHNVTTNHTKLKS